MPKDAKVKKWKEPSSSKHSCFNLTVPAWGAAKVCSVIQCRRLMQQVVPDRIMAIEIHPSTSRCIGFVGDKFGRLGMWDGGEWVRPRSEEAGDAPSRLVFAPHKRPISRIVG